VEIKPVNPWKWQDAFGFSQAIEFTGHSRVVTCAGQTSVDANGTPLHEGDMAAQIGQALDNIRDGAQTGRDDISERRAPELLHHRY
jgi:enamine deaminase RidA (YjgF/YER057c/UK114 family)